MAIHMEANIGATRTLVIALHILGIMMTTIHTGTMRGENTRTQIIARILGIAKTIDYGPLSGVRTKTQAIAR